MRTVMAARRGCQRIASAVRFKSTDSKSNPDEFPDYNTDVNVHQHKLKRPEPKLRNQFRKWDGLTGLADRTKESLIPDTLKEMEESQEFKITAQNLKRLGQAKLTKEERQKRQRALDDLGVPSFKEFWKLKAQEHGKEVTENLTKKSIEVLQLNIGIYCNQACSHCHVESSPKRTEVMGHAVAERCLEVLSNSPSIHTLDLTGGAPELCQEFRHIAEGGRKLNKTVIVRSNLTALLEPGQETTAKFFADNKLDVTASLPCYTAKNVNLQRGKGVFDKSIQALILLNSLGYGIPGSGLSLDLVYNPLGAYLPPKQNELEAKYKEEMWEVFGIQFNKLYTITNMPIKRFADFLYRRGELSQYMELLVRNYNFNTIDKIMCRDMLSVNWDGSLYDCDFNQQLQMGITEEGKGDRTIWDINSTSDLDGSSIRLDNHCYGCTAAMGSS